MLIWPTGIVGFLSRDHNKYQEHLRTFQVFFLLSASWEWYKLHTSVKRISYFEPYKLASPPSTWRDYTPIRLWIGIYSVAMVKSKLSRDIYSDTCAPRPCAALVPRA